jgi:hypothetical protein
MNKKQILDRFKSFLEGDGIKIEMLPVEEPMILAAKAHCVTWLETRQDKIIERSGYLVEIPETDTFGFLALPGKISTQSKL